MILQFKFILALTFDSPGNIEHLFWGVVLPSIVSQIERNGGELNRIPFGEYISVRKIK